MRPREQSMRCNVACGALIAGALAGCAAHQHVGRPPSAVEIHRINETALEDGDSDEPMRVRLNGPGHCVAGSCAERDAPWLPRYATGQARIDAADAEKVTFRDALGTVQEIPLAMIDGVSVRNRLRSTVIGGLVLGPPMGAVTWVFQEALYMDRHCSWECARIAGIALLAGTLVGGAIGYVISGRTTFLFDQAPAQ